MMLAAVILGGIAALAFFGPWGFGLFVLGLAGLSALESKNKGFDFVEALMALIFMGIVVTWGLYFILLVFQ